MSVSSWTIHLEALLTLADDELDKAGPGGNGGDVEAREKVRLLCRLYKELVRKYSLLDRDVAVQDVRGRLKETIAELRVLKRTVLSPEKTEPQESLYFKRHIAFGIPSVLGTYHEPKFDALGELMRHGENVSVLLQTIISEIEAQKTESQTTIQQWQALLTDVWQVLTLYGLQNVQIDEFIDVLENNTLHPAQVQDVLKMWQKELAWMVSWLNRTFHGPLMDIIGSMPHDELPEHLLALDSALPDFIDRAADVVMRDILSSVPGLIECDRFLEMLVEKFSSFAKPDAHEKHEECLSTRTQKYYDIQQLTSRDAGRRAPELGNKAKNLIYLREKGLRIPDGVVLPACSSGGYRRYADQEKLLATLKEAVSTIEKRTGKAFGGTERPLFLSVRSGSYPSMPGILSTILYCGMNVQTLDAFIRATDNPELGWDSYRRFIEHYGTTVLGLGDDYFEQLIKEYRVSFRLPAEGPLDAAHLRLIVKMYKKKLNALSLRVPDDVYEQLTHSVRAVYASWEAERARQFRKATGTSGAWGTSVTLMEMLSGNQEGGGSSMFFTRNPYTLERIVYGETRENATGADLASGRTSSRPLSRAQKISGQKSLEEHDPGLYQLHEDLAGSIEDAFGGLPQEVEATYSRDTNGQPVLTVLQTRRMEQGEAFSNKFEAICRMESRVIGHGTGANGGALSGVVSFAASPDEIEQLKSKSGMPVILIRKTANTDDVSLMPVVKGILTASGGVTSHAAVLAQKFGLSAVVACVDLKVNTDEPKRPYATLGVTRLLEGDSISIDGATGLIFSGVCFLSGEVREEV